jgi:hypothetical protein
MHRIRDALAAEGATHVVLEIADGLLQPQNRQLLSALPGFADSVLLAVGDALGAVGAERILASAGVTVSALSGLVSASPLAAREAEDATGLPVLSPEELATGAALAVPRTDRWV